ncbi:Scr1 family TA system antitoxin-like transcriptional regulator [Streptomyces sp. NPDC055078]
MTTIPPGALVAGTYLRHLRQTRRLTLDHVAGLARCSSRTVNLIETGRTVPAVAVQRLIAAHDVDPEEAQALRALWRWAMPGRRPMDDARGWQARLAACEAAATTITIHSAQSWPPILHTPAATAAWWDKWDLLSQSDKAAASTRPLPPGHGKTVTVFASQWWALRRRASPEWREQSAHVIALAERGEITVRIVPDHAFVLTQGVQAELWFGPGRALHVEEYAHAAYYSTDPARGRPLEQAHKGALSPAESLTRLQEAHAGGGD